MKNVTLLLTFLTISFGYSQNTIDFETGTTGSGWTWSTFIPEVNPFTDVITNPVSGGINTTNNVAIITGEATNEVWGGLGIESGHPAGDPSVNPSDMAPISFNSSNAYVKMMVYQVGFAAPVRLKFAGVTNASAGEIEVANTVFDQWVELEFNMSSYIGLEPMDQIIILPSYAPRGSTHTIYIDNISFSELPPPPVPTDAPEPPTEDPIDDNVISVYSEAAGYTQIPNDGFNDFGGSTLTLETIASNEVLKYANLDFTGLVFYNNQIDASATNTLHLDVWQPDNKIFRVKLVDYGPGPGPITEHEIVFTNPAAAQWIAYDIPLTDFPGVNTSNIAQLILSKVPGGGDLYVDNIYFYDKFVPPALTSFSYDFESGLSDFDLGSNPGDVGPGTTLNQVSNPYSAPSNLDLSTNINTSANVAELVGINDASYTHAEVIIPEKLDLSSGTKGFSIMVRGPRSVPVKFKIEGGDALELDQNYTDVGNWQKLTYDFSSSTSINNNKVVVFFDIVQAASSSASDDIFQFDNIVFDDFTSLSTNNFGVENFKIFPNPTQDFWFVKSNNQNIESIVIYDILGKQVFESKYNLREILIDSNSLSKGLYFAKIKTNNGESNLRLIKN